MESLDFNGKTILIAEDNDANFELLFHSCKSTGVTILRARTGVEAVAFCRKTPEIDLVLMDGMMPEMTGYDATKEIRAFRKDLPVIIITAYVNPASISSAVSSGASDYLAKPIGVEELLTILKKWLP